MEIDPPCYPIPGGPAVPASASAPEGAAAATSTSRNSGRASHVPQAEVTANRRTLQQAAGA